MQLLLVRLLVWTQLAPIAESRTAEVEILAFGYAYSIGVFLDYWERSLFPGEENRLTLTLAATLQSGFLWVVSFLTRRPNATSHTSQ